MEHSLLHHIQLGRRCSIDRALLPKYSVLRGTDWHVPFFYVCLFLTIASSSCFSPLRRTVAQALPSLQRGGAARSVMTLQETLMAQVPEKQKKLGELKKNHGSHV